MTSRAPERLSMSACRGVVLITLTLLSVASTKSPDRIYQNAAVGTMYESEKVHGRLYVFGLDGAVVYNTSNLLESPKRLVCADCSVGTVDGTGAMVLANINAGSLLHLPSSVRSDRMEFDQLVYRLVADGNGRLYAAMRQVGVGSYSIRKNIRKERLVAFRDDVSSLAATRVFVAIGRPGRVDVYSTGLVERRNTMLIQEDAPQVAFDGTGRLLVLLPGEAKLRRYETPGSSTFAVVSTPPNRTRIYADALGGIFLFDDRRPCVDGASVVQEIDFDNGSTRVYRGLRNVLAVTALDGALFESEQSCGFNAAPRINVFLRGSLRPRYWLTGAGLSDSLVAL